jgi:hypothetical protein
MIRVFNDNSLWLTLPLWFPVAYIVGLFVAAAVGAPR